MATTPSALCLCLWGPLEDMDSMPRLDREILAQSGVLSPWLHHATNSLHPENCWKGQPWKQPPNFTFLSRYWPLSPSRKKRVIAGTTLKSRLFFKGRGDSRMSIHMGQGGGVRIEDKVEIQAMEGNSRIATYMGHLLFWPPSIWSHLFW